MIQVKIPPGILQAELYNRCVFHYTCIIIISYTALVSTEDWNTKNNKSFDSNNSF